MANENYITTAEAADIVGISRQGVLKAICRGQLAATKFGSKRNGIWLILLGEAKRYKVERRKPGRPRCRDAT